MNDFYQKFLAALFILLVTNASALAEGTVTTVDLRKVFENYWKTKQGNTALSNRVAELEKEHSKLVSDWKKGREDYQSLINNANDQSLSIAEREKRKQSAEDKLKEIKATEETISQYERQARTTIEDEKKRMRDSIVSEIRNVLNARARSAGYNLVVDSSAESVNGTPIVLFGTNQNDITDDLLKALNAGAPADLPKVEDKEKKKK